MKNIQSSDEIRITRRSVLCGALVMAAVTAARTVLAEQMQNYLPPGKTAKPKGPLVFLDYDKDEIDFAYDQAPWAPNAREVSKRNAQKSTAALARLGPPRRLAYGPTDIEKLDIYTTKRPNAPINVFYMAALGGAAMQRARLICLRLSSMRARISFPSISTMLRRSTATS